MFEYIVADPATDVTGYPFGFSREDYLAELRYRETRDLQAEITAGLSSVERYQWLALEHADTPDGSRQYVEHQLSAMVEELERRQRLLRTHSDDPHAPRWPKADDGRFSARVEAVRAAWPIERYCRELLLLELIPAGRNKWTARCPLPGHEDRTPSFSIDSAKNVGYCHGCKRGGDVIKLAQYQLNTERFLDALTALEREGGAR